LAADWHGDTGKHVDLLEKLAQIDGESGEPFRFYVETQKALAEQVRTAGLFSERGSEKAGATGTASERALKLAQALTKDGTPLAQALGQVFQENPALYDEYTREVSARKGA
jgi:hypothetical protein